MIRAVVLDVGGTLWPDVWPECREDVAARTEALLHLEPGLSEQNANAVTAELSAWRHPSEERQQTDTFVRDTLARLELSDTVDAAHVIRAMSIPARGRIELFAGARRLLKSLKERHIRVVLATNVVWRSGQDQFRDLEDFGLAGCVTACVSSLDVGWRKPHRAFFSAVLDAAGCPPAECVMVGDSEKNDVLPARRLGMATVRVAIEQDFTGSTAALFSSTSLDGVADWIIDRA